jgi:UDPglucose 6-dehydrogenase
MKITVVGTGYVGLTTAAGLSQNGHSVICLDTDERKIGVLASGGCTIYEPDLPELLIKNADRLRFTTDLSEAYATPDVVIIAVGTPEKEDGSANLSYVYKVVDELFLNIKHKIVVVVKSTVPVGTNDELEDYILSKHEKSQATDTSEPLFEFVSNPEFLSQGTAVLDTLSPCRIIVGAKSEFAYDVLSKIYANVDTKIIFTDRRSAELTKYAANNFLALKVSYINEIANLCEKTGANIEDVVRGIGSDPRIGSNFLKAGIGYGGSCFPKDTLALHHISLENNSAIKTIKACIEVNNVQKLKLLDKARNYYKDFNGVNVAILGLTFKPETDDLREAPSLINMQVLLDEGAKIKAWDKLASGKVEAIFPQIKYPETIEETLENADVCFIFTEWTDVKNLQLGTFSVMKTPIILDGRNCFDLAKIEKFPFVYVSIGRKNIDNRAKMQVNIQNERSIAGGVSFSPQIRAKLFAAEKLWQKL